jgi:hypothetical protein
MQDENELFKANPNPTVDQYEALKDMKARMFAVEQTIAAVQAGFTYDSLTDGVNEIYGFIAGTKDS